MTPPAIGCYFVQGRLTLYLPSVQGRHLLPMDSYNQASNTIKNEMDNGDLAKCDHRIFALTYLNDDSFLLLNSTISSANRIEEKNSLPLSMAWALIGILGGVFVGIYAKSRYKRYYTQQKKLRSASAVTCDDSIEVMINKTGVSPTSTSTSSSISFDLLESEWVDFQSDFNFARTADDMQD